MAYTKTTWAKRIVTTPDKYALTDLGGGNYTIEPVPGAVTQEGTPLTEVYLNNLETQYTEAKADVDAVLSKVIKSADEIVSNSTVLQNDNELLFAMAANETWEVELLLRAIGTAAAGFKFSLAMPAACAINGNFFPNAAGVWQRVIDSGTYGPVMDANIVPVLIKVVVVNGANAGNFQLQWAQAGAEVSDTKVLKNSYIIAHRLA